MVDMSNMEMVICPKCGRPFPKMRRDLGYNYCVNCSTEKPLSCIIEGTMEGNGDDTVTCTVRVVSAEEAQAIEHIRNHSNTGFVDTNPENEETELNLNTIECDAENEDDLESDFGMTIRTEEEFEEYCSIERQVEIEESEE